MTRLFVSNGTGPLPRLFDLGGTGPLPHPATHEHTIPWVAGWGSGPVPQSRKSCRKNLKYAKPTRKT